MTIEPSPVVPAPPAPPAVHAEQAEFLHRVIRIVAMVMLAYAAVHLVQFVLYVLIQGIPWRNTREPSAWIERATELSGFGTFALLLVGAIGMLKGKTWSRPAVLWWAVLQVVIELFTGAAWIVHYSKQVAAASATTRAIVGQPVWQMMLWQVMWWLSNASLPLLVWLILRQPEVLNFFSRVGRGGFEVVPFANAVTGGAADRDDASSRPNG